MLSHRAQKKSFLLITLISSLLCINTGQAATTGELVADCKKVIANEDGDTSALTQVQAVHCVSYIRGFTDGYQIRAMLENDALEFCLPNKVNNAQMAKVFIKTAEDFPEKLHEPAAAMLLPSLSVAFPCED